MKKSISHAVLPLTVSLVTLAHAQTAHAGDDDDRIDSIANVGVFATYAVQIPVVAFGTSDLLKAARGRDATFGYGVAEAALTAPALALNSAIAVGYFANEEVTTGSVVLATLAVALPAYTFAHGVRSAIKAKRRREFEQRDDAPATSRSFAAPGNTTAAFADSSKRKATWELAAVPVTDGKSVGAGVGVLGRF